MHQNFEDRIATVLEMVEDDIASEWALMMWICHMDDFARGLDITMT